MPDKRNEAEANSAPSGGSAAAQAASVGGSYKRDCRIGVISDTHGLLRPEALAALRGVDCIVHAGDIGGPAILERLATLAPVHAVRGNNDHGAWADALPEMLQLAIGGVAMLVIHDVSRLDAEPGADIAMVISGHSHRPRIDRRGPLLYVNPGSAGPRRFSLPVTIAILSVAGGRIVPELVPLQIDGVSATKRSR